MSEGKPQIEQPKEEPKASDAEEGKPLTVQGEDTLPFDPDILEDAPPEFKQKVMEMSFGMMGMSGPAANPLMKAIAKVMDGDHLTTLIQSMERSEELEFQNAKHMRWIGLIVLCVVLAFSTIAIGLLKDSNPDLLETLITMTVTLVGGLGAGYGVKAWWDQRRQ